MKTRVLTALALIPVVLAAVFVAHPLPLGILLILVTWIASAEIGNVASEPKYRPWLGLLLMAGTVFWYSGHAFGVLNMEIQWGPLLMMGSLALSVIGGAALSLQKPPSSSKILVELSSLWVAAPLCALYTLHLLSHRGSPWNWQSFVLVPLFSLWAGDSAAIFAGKLFGKHLLAPKISPKKTVEGAIANLIFCILGAVLGGYIAGVPLVSSVWCGVVAGLLGQAGDLFQSSWKRRFDKKDSGSLLPGHGGILDRIDSLLFTAPIVGLLIALSASAVNWSGE